MICVLLSYIVYLFDRSSPLVNIVLYIVYCTYRYFVRILNILLYTNSYFVVLVFYRHFVGALLASEHFKSVKVQDIIWGKKFINSIYISI